jgi:hypothetical protein
MHVQPDIPGRPFPESRSLPRSMVIRPFH